MCKQVLLKCKFVIKVLALQVKMLYNILSKPISKAAPLLLQNMFQFSNKNRNFMNFHDQATQFLHNQEYKQNSISFFNEVLSCVLNPSLIGSHMISLDASKRADKYLKEIISPGSYSIPTGIPSVKKNIALKLSEENRIPVPQIDNIFILGGVTQCANIVLSCLIAKKNDSIMVPVPQYSLYSTAMNVMGGNICPYYLQQSQRWDVNLQELQRSINKCRLEGKNVKGIVIVNPGNPTGKILSLQKLKEIISFAMKNKLVIISDEVSQDFVYEKENRFHSTLKALKEMGQNDLNQCQLISMYSISKFPLGMCGVRAGYLHCHNINSQILEQFMKLWNFHTCNQLGQILLDLTINPPLADVQQSTRLKFISQKQNLNNYMQRRMKKISTHLSGFKNITLNQIDSGKYLFPKIQFTRKAIQAAGQISVDQFYCQEMRKETGISSIPGSIFGMKNGQYYFRFDITNFSQAQLQEKLNLMKIFNDNFHKKYE